ncbi:MAG: hypothetical protein L3I99_04330 [Sulfurimonas sp.]|nr:hypothetical protein [Sulfurimonas sp.]
MYITSALFVVLLLFATPLSATYKILVSSHITQQMADKTKLKIKSELDKNDYFSSHQDVEGYKIHSRKLHDIFVVTIEPFVNQKVLNNILKIVKKSHESAFISSLSKKSEIKKFIQIETPAPQLEPVIMEQKNALHAKPKLVAPITANIDNSKYLKTKSILKDKEIDNSSNYDIYIVAILLMLIATVIAWLLKQRKITTSESRFDNMLMSEHPSKIVPQDHHLHVDLHSHLIPGIDDGSKTMEESIELIKRLKSFGYNKIITTPHIMMHRYPNSSANIKDGLAAIRERLNQEQIDIKIEAAAEYYLDEHLMDLVAQYDILTFGKNYLLFEMSYINHPVNLEDMVMVMIEAGYTPVLAHPERYVYMSKNFSKYAALKALGVHFQLNINSLAGYYSDEVQKIAFQLVDAGMINFVGSDTHRMHHLDTLKSVIKSKVYRDLFKKNKILNNTL